VCGQGQKQHFTSLTAQYVSSQSFGLAAMLDAVG
jgi:hypothetical protein